MQILTFFSPLLHFLASFFLFLIFSCCFLSFFLRLLPLSMMCSVILSLVRVVVQLLLHLLRNPLVVVGVGAGAQGGVGAGAENHRGRQPEQNQVDLAAHAQERRVEAEVEVEIKRKRIKRTLKNNSANNRCSPLECILIPHPLFNTLSPLSASACLFKLHEKCHT